MPRTAWALSKCEIAEPIPGLPFRFEMKVEALLLFCLLFLENPQMLYRDFRPTQQKRPKRKESELGVGGQSSGGALPAPSFPDLILLLTLREWRFPQGNYLIFSHFLCAWVDCKGRIWLLGIDKMGRARFASPAGLEKGYILDLFFFHRSVELLTHNKPYIFKVQCDVFKFNFSTLSYLFSVTIVYFSFLNILCKWNQILCTLFVWLLSLIWLYWELSILLL